MASEKEINVFKDLIGRWIDQDRAKRLIIEARKWMPEPTEWLAQRALREWEEFIGWEFEWWVDVEEWETISKQAWDVWELFEWATWPAIWDVFWLRETEFWKDIKEKFWDIPSTISTLEEWVEKTIVWTLESWKQVFEWLARAWSRKTFEFANFIRVKLGKEPLTEEQGRKLQWPAGWLDTKIQEDLLDIWQGSLSLWFTSVFPWSTVAINTITETKWWEEIFWLLSTVIGKWGKVVNKLPWLQEFRASLPEERKLDFDNFVWQIATLWVTKWITKWVWKLLKIRDRSVIEIWANILKPTPKTPLDFDSWVKWLQQLWDIKPKSFKELIKIIETKQKKDFPALKKWLENAQKNVKLIKDVSVLQALEWLGLVLEKQWWKKFTKIRDRVEELTTKHESIWLTLVELQELKWLHTRHQDLFTELWAEKTWMSNQWLLEIRKDIKILIEQEALKWWFSKVKEINTKFWELQDAVQFVKLQEWSLKSYLWRQGKQSLLQDTVSFALELPWVKQWFTQPVQTAFWKLSRWLREWKVNPIEVQQQLPALFKELRKAWVSEWTIIKINNNIIDKLVWINLITWLEQED